MMRAGRKIKDREEAIHAITLCDTSSISLADAKYYEDLRKYYLKQAMGEEAFEAENKRKALDPADPKTVELVQDIFKAAEKFI